LVLTVAFLMACLTGTESVAAAVSTWTSPAPASAPGERPDQSWGSAAGLDHRASASDTAASAEERGKAPQQAPGQLPLEERSTAQDLGDTAQEPEPEPVEVLDPPAPEEIAGFDEITSEELVEDRDLDSRTFLNEDGTYTTRFYDEQVNYRLADGSWQEVDATLRKDRLDGLSLRAEPRWTTASTELGIDFAADAQADPLVTVHLDAERSVGYSLDGASASTGVAEGSVITYPQVTEGVDLEFLASNDTVKETLVLHDPDTPRQWRFPLELRGLTASLDEHGAVAFRDDAGDLHALMPPGWMEDSDFGERSGEGAISGGVSYTLLNEDGRQILVVDLDEEWLLAPERVYPVRVDPSVTRVGASSSTYVQKPYNQNFSTSEVLKTGTYDGGSHTAASFLRFSGVNSTLKNAWVLDAKLALYNTWSYSCNARPVTVHPITQNWSASTLKNYPGPSTGAALGSKRFAHGWRPDGASTWNCAPKWEAVALGSAGRKLVDDWTHGRKANYGLAVKASTSDSYGWKQFGSSRYPNGKPSLDVTWTKYGATYKAGQLTVPVTATTEGSQRITVTNQGRETWVKGGNYQLTYKLYNSAGTELTSSSLRRFTTMPQNVAPGASVTVNAKIAPLQPGTYSVVWSMTDYGTRRFTTDGIPGLAVKISTSNIPPWLVAAAPASGAVFDTLTPSLWARGTDPDKYPSALKYTFEVCEVEGENARKNCRKHSRIDNRQWAVPAGWLAWEKNYAWYAYVYDGSGTSLRPNPAFFTTRVPQPAVTGYLGGEDGRDFGARTGNYATSATDASVATVGPELAVHRTYNSLDPRTDTAFGRGWSTRWDMRAQAESNGNVLITLPTGRRARFGRDAGGSYTGPGGSGDTLVAATGGGWVLRTHGGTQYAFDAAGLLTRTTDGAGREQQLTYSAGKLATVRDVQSGRTLTFTWSGGYVSSVTTSPVGPGEPGLSWAYVYEGGRLTEVCPPDSARGCTQYDYTDGTHYRSAVLDATPVSYWPLADSAGEVAESIAPARTGFNHATYYNVEHGAAGAMSGSTDTAVTFNGTDSYVELPHTTLNTSTFLTVELWFKTTEPGALLGFQNEPLEDGYPSQKNPPLTIDADGKLSGFFYTGTVAAIDPIKSTAPVTDGQWHHAVLTTAGTTQTLYLDGSRVGSRTGPLGHRELSYTYLGAGWSDPRWDGGPDGVRYFQGQIDDAAVYHYPLDAVTVAEHYAARNPAGQLARVTLPSGRVHAAVTYDAVTGRVTDYTDENGGTWQVSEPAYANGSQTYADDVLANQPTGYWRLDDRAGVVAHSETGDATNGVYPELLRGAAGPFADGDSRAPVFDGQTVVEVPTEAWGETDSQSIELWFKTSESGVLVGMQDTEFGERPTGWWPMLLVDRDGMLRARLRYPGDDTTLISNRTVNDDSWHHVVLSGTSEGQVLYLDGFKQASNSHGTDTRRLSHTGIGGGFSSVSWDGEGGGEFNFSGQIAEVAFYDHALVGPGNNWTDGRTAVGNRYRMRSALVSGTGAGYREEVMSSAPAAYWRLDESSGRIASDEITGADATASMDGVLNAAMGIFGAGNGTSGWMYDTGRYLALPPDLLAGTRELTAELWFRTGSHAGVLLGFQNQPIGQTPTSWRAVLNIDANGKLRGEWWVPGLGGARPIVSSEAVTDNEWHHAVLTGSGTTQTLYLDGVKVGTLDGPIAEQALAYSYLGGGYGSGGWMSAPADTYYFRGGVDEVALYRHSLTAEQVAAHYRARSRPEQTALGATVTVTDPQGHTTDTTYAPLRSWRTVAKTDADGGVTSYAYDTGGFLNTVTDPNGNAAITGHDQNGNVVSTTTCRAAKNCQTSFATYYHDASKPLDPRNGKPLTVSDARSSDPADTTYRTTTTYTSLGQVKTVRLPDGRAATRAYTAGGEPAVGDGTAPAGLVATIETPGGAVTRYEYTAGGDVARITEPSGLVSEFGYDGLGRQVTRTEISDAVPDGVSTTYGYDAMSRIVTETGAAVENELTGETHRPEVRRTYDPDSRLRTETAIDLSGNSADRATSYLYDGHGRVSHVIDAEGNDTFSLYDNLGRLTQQTDALGTVVRYAYTPRGQLAETVLEDWDGDPSGEIRDLTLESRAYDPAGRLASVTDAMGATVSYTYTDDNLLATATAEGVTQADGSRRDIVLEDSSYDAAGYLIQQSTGNGTTEVTQEIDATGRTLATVLDPNGLNRRTTFDYDADDRVLEEAQEGGNNRLRAAYTYDTAGNLLTQTVADGGGSSTVRNEYDQRGLPTASISPLGTEDGADPTAFTTEFRYDVLGRPVEQTAPEVSVEREGGPAQAHRPQTLTGYNAFGEVNAVQDAEGHITRYTFDQLGRTTSVALPDYTQPGGGSALQAVSELAYDPLSRVTRETDPLGRTTEYAYDQLSRLIQKIEPLAEVTSTSLVADGGEDWTNPFAPPDNPTTALDTTEDGGRGVHRYTWTPTGLQLSATNPTGAVTQATYDELGRPLTSTVVERYPELRNLTTKHAWDDAGNQTETVTPDGYWNRLSYNSAGELLRQYDAWSDIATHEYDAFGRRVATADGEDHRAVLHHDHLGNVVRTDDYGRTEDVQRSTQTEFDAAGNRIAVTSASGARHSFRYDALGRLTEQTEPVDEGATLTNTFGYDANGSRTRHTDGRGNATVYTYTPWGLPESTIEPATAAHPAAGDRTWTTLYDASGQPVTSLLPGAVTRNRIYNGLGLMVRETGAGAEAPTQERLFTYDLLGRMTSQNADSTYTYNDRGLLLTAAGAGGAVSYAYDDDGRMTYRSDAQADSWFSYNHRGELARASSSANDFVLHYEYDFAGRLIEEGHIRPEEEEDNTDNPDNSGELGAFSWRPPYDANRLYSYDDLGQLSHDRLFDGDASDETSEELAATDYQYDIDGRLIGKSTRGTAGAGSHTYDYDDAGRLTAWTYGDTTVDYAWDDSGNRTQAGELTAAYDERNRLLTDGEADYAYSPRGTLSSISPPEGSPRSLTFDAFERKLTDGDTTFRYDSLDRVTHHGDTRFSYDGGSNNLLSDGTSTYTRAPDGTLLTATEGEHSQWLLTDQHTDVVAGVTVDGSALAGSRSYDPFGQPLDAEGANSALGYQSGWTDPDSGDVNMSARWYQPGTGRFASRDTMLLDPSPSVQANRYGYANAAPMDYTDPEGESAKYLCKRHWILWLACEAPEVLDEIFVDHSIGDGGCIRQYGMTCAERYDRHNSGGSCTGISYCYPSVSSVRCRDVWECPRSNGNNPPRTTDRGRDGDGGGNSKGGRRCRFVCGGTGVAIGTGFVGGTAGAGTAAGGAAAGGAIRYAPPQNPNRGPNAVPAPAQPPPVAAPVAPITWTPGMGVQMVITAGQILKMLASPAYTPDVQLAPGLGGGPSSGGDGDSHQDCRRGGSGWVDHWNTDAAHGNRATGVSACLDEAYLEKNKGSDTITSVRPPGYQWAGRFARHLGLNPRDSINNCHLLGKQLSGSGTVLANLATCSRQANAYVDGPGNLRHNMSNFENRVRSAIKSGETVEYMVVPRYGGDRTVPVSFEMTANGLRPDGQPGINFDVVIPNSIYSNERGQWRNLGLVFDQHGVPVPTGFMP
jgi:RHS repeat-associated protein